MKADEQREEGGYEGPSMGEEKVVGWGRIFSESGYMMVREWV